VEVVFDSKAVAAGKRREAWRDAICEIYLQVDCEVDRARDYAGYVQEARYGVVTITDAIISPQIIRRRPCHVGNFDKDCYYIGIEHIGAVDIRQAGSSFELRPGKGSLYYANEPYELHCNVTSRQFWIELPRAAFDARFDGGRPPMLKYFDLRRGLGRIAAEFCATLARESGSVPEPSRDVLGDQFMDLLASALSAEPDRQSTDENGVQGARLRSVRAYIEAHLDDPNLSPANIAMQNGISVRYLHHLFRQLDVTVSDWLRFRRLERCRELLASPRHAPVSITEIAFSCGFSSSSHFSNLFRAQYGMRPSDARCVAERNREIV
jgi:AraC-like DNA-binding protein